MIYLYPILLSLLPALHLYINNRVPIKYAYPTWIAIAIFTGFLVFISKSIIKNQKKAGIIASFFSIGFFYFELILRVLGSVSFTLGITKTRIDMQNGTIVPILIFAIWSILLINAVRFILQSDSLVLKLNTFLIVVSLILIISPLISIGKIIINIINIENTVAPSLPDNYLLDLPDQIDAIGNADESRPDIYYLIFDAFAGQKILSEYYDTDISDFIGQLEKRGFYVAAESKTNYSQTICSLPSTLNMGYLDDVSRSMNDRGSWSPLAAMLQENLVSNFLDKNGYELVNFSSGFWPTEGIRADKKYSPFFNLNEYQEVLLVNTPVMRFYPNILYDIHRERIKFILSNLVNVKSEGKSKFVFSHIYSPHPPFVFDENGNHIHPPRPFNKFDADGYRLMGGTTAEYTEQYSGQLNYLFGQIILIVDEILLEAKTPPILIIQGDHGPGSMITQHHLEETNLDERFSIMNAYYFPDQNYDTLYPEITPVNTYRIILNQYFNADLSLLPDKNYFSTVFRPYDFTDMTEILE